MIIGIKGYIMSRVTIVMVYNALGGSCVRGYNMLGIKVY
jgi:hypothetical protein